MALPTELSLFGAGRFARDTAAALRARGVRVRALLTSGEPPAAMQDGVPCRRLTAADLAAPLWVAVFNHQRTSDYGALNDWLGSLASTGQVVWPQAWYTRLAPALGWRFWLEAPARYDSAGPEIAALRERLDDDASRRALDAIVDFRRSAHHRPPPPVAEPQYAPGWLRERLAGRALSVVDGGAYRGETLRELAGLLPIRRAWAFEPDAANFAHLQQAAAVLPIDTVEAVPAGLSDRCATLAFAAGDGAASHVDEEGGGTRIEVVTLDEQIAGETVDFIKFDVEGHEMQALAGARETLRRCRPVLAIAAYHRWDDLWRIAGFVDALDAGYRLRIAVHQHNSFDTVLYAFH